MLPKYDSLTFETPPKIHNDSTKAEGTNARCSNLNGSATVTLVVHLENLAKSLDVNNMSEVRHEYPSPQTYKHHPFLTALWP